MNPNIVLPIHDLDGTLFAHLESITPALQELFAYAFVGISPQTAQVQQAQISRLSESSFFQINLNPPGTQAGEHFVAGCRAAVAASAPEQMIHIGGLDRVAFALSPRYCTQFRADVRAINSSPRPVLFQRSPAAWATHPDNYRGWEDMLTRAGEMLFGRTLDFAWCHLAVPAQRLQAILPKFQNRDISALAEFVLHLMDDIEAVDVDWLAWEDPFAFGRDPVQFKREREVSQQENYKRLSYVIPKLQLMLDFARQQDDQL